MSAIIFKAFTTVLWETKDKQKPYNKYFPVALCIKQSFDSWSPPFGENKQIGSPCSSGDFPMNQ